MATEIKVTPQEANADLFTFWWGCIEASSEIDDNPVKDEDLILSFCSHGTTCYVFAKDIRLVCKIINEAKKNG